jgi:hypothetical protein
VKTFISLAVIIALASVGYMLGGEYITWEPEMGARVGALAGVLFGLLIFMAMRTQT